MSSEKDVQFTKENLNTYLNELSKHLRKTLGKNASIEIVLVGGAAILANYDFRQMTRDVDALIQLPSVVKEAANKVGDKYGLPNSWLNSDFTRTSSYSPKLREVSKYYRTFSNVLQVRTVSAEYLVAMKLCSYRPYKNDGSDIVGIFNEQEKIGNPITTEALDKAMKKLYGGWEKVSPEAIRFLHGVFNMGEYDKIYNQVQKNEREAKHLLQKFEKDYPNTLNQENMKDVLASLKSRTKQPNSTLDSIIDSATQQAKIYNGSILEKHEVLKNTPTR